MISIVILLLEILVNVVFGNKTRPVVQTKLGTVRGVEANDGDYNMYMAVPYAKVNLTNPFGDAIPIVKYESIIEADTDSLACIQWVDTDNTTVGKLDCLELNIYVPKTANENNPIPVLVYLYGGNYMIGKANRTYFGPRFLVRHNIILITIEHRNGPYGFLCVDTPEVPGNQGFKDQTLALKWIQENIKSFGGDPDKVTLSGHSSGAISTHFHYVYGDKGLFSKVIMASGTSYILDSVKKSNLTIPFKITEAAGFKTDDLNVALDYMRQMDPNMVVRINNELGIIYRPCKEKVFENVTNFVTDYPNFIKKDRDNMPILIGNTINETKFDLDKYQNNTLNYVIHRYLNMNFNLDSDNLIELSNIVEMFYDDGKKSVEEIEQDKVFFSTDFRYLHPSVIVAKEGIDFGSKVFMYLFPYLGGRDYTKRKYNKQFNTTVHADELGYLFDFSVPYINKTFISEDDQLMIDRFTTIWTNFVKYGDPTPQTSSLLPIKWKPVTKDSFYCMIIDSELRMIKRPFHTRMAFWELLYDIYRKHLLGYNENDQE